MKKIFLLLLTAAVAMPAMSQDDDTDTGLWLSAEAQKKVTKLWSVSAEAEYRLRENFGSTDRWTISLGTAYKLTPWLKADAGYKFMRVLSDDETKWKDNGVDADKWTPAWWATRHRLYASLTASLAVGRLDLSLRERWQYTYRPATTVDRYDVDDDEWGENVKDGKAKHVLRSRLQAEYNIPKCKFDPFGSVELYNQSGGFEKIRYTIGADWKLSKQHNLSFYYRYLDGRKGDPNQHAIGIGYKYKF